MLVLVATNELQGDDPGDFAWTVEGELVTPLAAECDSGDRCGCNRGFPGLASDRATTTATVVDRPGVTADDLRDAVHAFLERGGWIELLEDTEIERSGTADRTEIDALVEAIVDEHVEMIALVCSTYEVGTVVTRHGNSIARRSRRRAA